MGWIRVKPARMREVASQSNSLERDVRALQGTAGRPLLQHKAAEVLLRKWAPAVFDDITAGM